MAGVLVACPYCDFQNEVQLSDTTEQWFAHPTDGKRRRKLGYIDKELGVKIFNDFWSPKVLPGLKEISIPCESCKYEFHVSFFVEKVDIDKWFDIESCGVKSRPLTDRMLDLFHLHYIISSILVAIILWLALAVPVIVSGGFSKIINDLSLWLSIPSVAIALSAVRFHRENIEDLKNPVESILKVKIVKMKGWTYERFKCYIFGRGCPRRLLLPNFIGFLFLLTYIAYHLIVTIRILPNLTLFENSVVDHPEIKYTSYAHAIFAPVLWGSLAFIFGTALWLAISTSWVTYKMGAWLPLHIDTLHKTGGVQPLGRFALTGTIPFVAAQFALVPSILLTVREVSWTIMFPQIFLQILAIIILSITTIILFFSSLYSIHRGMKKEKGNALNKITQRYHEKQKELLEITSKKLTNNIKKKLDFLGDSLSSLEFFEKRVESMRTWPYDLGIIARLIGSTLIPFIALLLERLISTALGI